MVNRLVAVLAVMTGAPQQAAHPLHTTLTTVEWHAETAALQVAVRVFSQDLSDAIARQHGNPMTPPTSDAAACRYARAALQVREASGRALVITRCEVAHSADVTWIHLAAPAATPAGVRILNAFLFEVFSDQINVVQTNLQGRARTLLFTAGDQMKELTGV